MAGPALYSCRGDCRVRRDPNLSAAKFALADLGCTSGTRGETGLPPKSPDRRRRGCTAEIIATYNNHNTTTTTTNDHDNDNNDNNAYACVAILLPETSWITILFR